MLLRLSLLCLLALRLTAAETYDVVVYGGTSAGVIAAVQAKKMGKSVLIVGPDVHLGGLSSGGLGYTDTGNKAVIGGLARNFYHRVWAEYQKDSTWAWQRPEAFGNKGQGTVAMDKDERTMWIFEPGVAEKVFEDYVKEFGLTVLRDEWLDRTKGVRLTDGRIAEITMLSGKKFAGKMFIDATYEGDLLAAAGVSYHVGREANSVYGEEWNGNQVGILHHGHHFGAVKQPVSAYKIPGDPSSGLLPRISAEPPGVRGEATNASKPIATAGARPTIRTTVSPSRSRRTTTPRSTSCLSASSMPAGARRSTSSTCSPTARPTRITMALSASTTSG